MEMRTRFAEFLREKYYNELVKASREEIGALIVDFNDIDRFDPIIADQLLEDPNTVLKAFQEAVEGFDISEDSKINVRIKNLPESRNIRIRNLRTKHIGKLYCVEATVKSASEVKPQVYEAIFKCPECGKDIIVPQETNIIQKPYVCECGRRGDFDMSEKRMYDMRWITGVEPFEITTGEQPGEIAIFLKEDLTTPRMQKKTDPGTRLVINGVLREMPKRIKGRLSTRMDTYIEANYVEPSSTEYEEIDISPKEEELIQEMSKDPNIYEKLRDSIAPGIWGVEEIKESIVMQMFGGVPHIMPDGSRVRGNIHILITGDPSVGKSQILKLVSSVIPRGRYVSGKGDAGATPGAVRVDRPASAAVPATQRRRTTSGGLTLAWRAARPLLAQVARVGARVTALAGVFMTVQATQSLPPPIHEPSADARDGRAPAARTGRSLRFRLDNAHHMRIDS